MPVSSAAVASHGLAPLIGDTQGCQLVNYHYLLVAPMLRHTHELARLYTAR
jgi:hypothetical protein